MKRRKNRTIGQQYWRTDWGTGGEEDKRTEQYDRRTGLK